jgi:hypothetical protein
MTSVYIAGQEVFFSITLVMVVFLNSKYPEKENPMLCVQSTAVDSHVH